MYQFIWQNRKISKYYACYIAFGISSFIVSPLATYGQGILMFNAWYPCDITHAKCFWIAYTLQLVGLTTIAFAHVANECLIFAFLHNVNLQLQLIDSRIQMSIMKKLNSKISEQMDTIKSIVEDHVQCLK